MRVVLDTNVLISAFLSPSGTCARSLEQLEYTERTSLVASASVLIEYQRICSYPRLRLTASLEALLLLWRDRTVVVRPTNTLTLTPDPADNRFLECAEAAQADFLITGNLRHFPPTHGPTQVVSPSDFLLRISSASAPAEAP